MREFTECTDHGWAASVGNDRVLVYVSTRASVIKLYVRGGYGLDLEKHLGWFDALDRRRISQVYVQDGRGFVVFDGDGPHLELHVYHTDEGLVLDLYDGEGECVDTLGLVWTDLFISDPYTTSMIWNEDSRRFLVFPDAEAQPGGVDFVQVVDQYGHEIAYWVSDEWAEAPQEVMGAILGAFYNGGRSDDETDE